MEWYRKCTWKVLKEVMVRLKATACIWLLNDEENTGRREVEGRGGWEEEGR